MKKERKEIITKERVNTITIIVDFNLQNNIPQKKEKIQNNKQNIAFFNYD